MAVNNDILIELRGVSKKFSKNLKRSMWYGLKDMAGLVMGIRTDTSVLRADEFWAVKDIDFTLKRGECLGLIGRNGAGKSTLLKMLNGLIRPDEGSITMRGKVGALIELGAGFNPLLSGRENIFVSGQIRGFSKKEIKTKLDAIVDFSEIEEFIDSPVQNYSSGMKVRLGFAVAAQMEPDILLIDEVLAVGDLGFVLKCFNTIDELMKNTAVIFVSHSMPMVSRICSEIMLLEKGEVTYFDNDVSAGIDKYYSNFSRETKNTNIYDRGGDVSLLEIYAANHTLAEGIYSLNRLDDLKITIKLKTKKSDNHPFLGITIQDREQRPIGICMNEQGLSEKNIFKIENGFTYYQVQVVIPKINLSKGIYSITFSVSEKFRYKPILRLQSIYQFQVCSKHAVWSPVEFESYWT